MQRLVADALFPVGKGDWYALKGYGNQRKENWSEPFRCFVEKQKNNSSAQYYSDFKEMSLSLSQISSLLANEEKVQLEVLSCIPDFSDENKPGNGKHIVYFSGANTYYQACFRDISTAVRETGATVHAFNYPGTGLSTGRVSEANDLVNSGMAVVGKLIKEGVHPDDIILQGDCYGRYCFGGKKANGTSGEYQATSCHEQCI